ncbi:MAG: hypothetical protein JWN14_1623 [Chthonomonadales bacterium]|nr:hypothetical protein [Chthonomonadales bacterium]
MTKFSCCSALCLALLGGLASASPAQDAPPTHQGSSAVSKPAILRVLITDCIDRSPDTSSGLGPTVTGLLNVALDRYGRRACDVISRQEVGVAADRMGLPWPEATAPSGHWKEEDKIRLGKTLDADLLCNGQVAGAVNRKNAKLRDFAIAVSLRDITLQFARSGGYTFVRKKRFPLPLLWV